MANPFIGEIRLFAGSFAPLGWSFCDGRLVSIADNETLFNLIGTTYGGDGQNTYALPDLRGRVPVHQGTGQSQQSIIGQLGGTETVTLTANQLPQHTHALIATSAPATSGTPGGTALATTTGNSYGPAPATVAMAADAIGPQGGSQPHENMAPFTAVSYIISMFGIFPSQG